MMRMMRMIRMMRMMYYLRCTILFLSLILSACSMTQQAGSPTNQLNPKASTTPILATIVMPTATLAAAPVEPQKLTITSPAFSAGTAIPERHSCNGADLSPALSWGSVPKGTQSLAIIVEDSDANNYTHWVVFNIPATMSDMPEAIAQGWKLPEGGWQGQNAFSNAGYNGPCPPTGREHHYVFQIYAIDMLLDLESSDLSPVGKGMLRDAMKGHILAEGSLMGVYTSK